MGAGYVAFFTLIKVIIFLCFLFSLANIYKVVANVKGSNCFDTKSDLYDLIKTQAAVCGRDWITIHSIANYGFQIDWVDKGIMLGFYFVFLLYLIFYFPTFSNIGETIDKKSDMPSDWTVILKDVTPGITEAQLLNYFDNAPDLPGLVGSRVEKINTSYNIAEYVKLKHEFDLLSAKIRAQRLQEAKTLQKKVRKMDTKLSTQGSLVASPDKYKDSDHNGNESPEIRSDKTPERKATIETLKSNPVSPEFHNLVEKCKKLKEELDNVKKTLRNDPKYSNNIYYMTLTKKEYHDELLERFGSKGGFFNRFSSKWTVQGVGGPISFRMKAAPEPTDILWSNLSTTLCQRIGARIWTFLVTFILVGIGFGIVLGLKIAQRQLAKNLKSTDSAFDSATLQFRALSVAISFVIFCINTILPMAMRSLTQFEKHMSNTDFYESLTFKITFVSVELPRLNSSTRTSRS